MIEFFIIFFFFLYVLCESMKYKYIESAKLQTKKRLYNKKIVVIKALLLFVFIVLIIVNRLFFGVIENSAGFKSVIGIIFLLTVLALPSIIDLKRVLNGYNENLLNERGEQ